MNESSAPPSSQFRSFKYTFKNNLFPGDVHTHVTIGTFFLFWHFSTVFQNSRVEEFSMHTKL
uniref:Uncharacterized protein n=1 Tax=Mus musculus TaxID=10090 RepID=Q3UP76_MOUSE|nr:unnamed protein product [Mus musculus]